VNDNAILYALSTLAQTCAALAAFVGAVGLFRLQALRDGHQSAEERLRSSLVDVRFGAPEASRLPLADILRHVEAVRANPASVGTGNADRIEDAFTAWSSFRPSDSYQRRDADDL